MTGGEEPQLAIHERIAEHFLSPYACEFGRNENGYFHYNLQSAAIPLYELKGTFPECRELIVSEESLSATLYAHYPAYCEEYNAIVTETDQIPQISAPENLFLQEQLDWVRAGAEQETGQESTYDEEKYEDDYGEQADYEFEA